MRELQTHQTAGIYRLNDHGSEQREGGARRYRYAIDPQGDSTANKVLHMVGQGKRVLELGCGPGMMTQAMKEQQACAITAIELDPALAEQARPFCERIIIADLDGFDFAAAFADERFDVVVAADVLEHLKDPWRCLEQLRGLLASPAGYLVASIPNIAHNAVVAQLLSGRFPYQRQGLLDRTHLRFFTRADIEALLLATGFVPDAWERNRIAEQQSEFWQEWLMLPEAVRNALGGAPEGQTYQFIVKAFPSSDAVWLARTRAEIAERDEEMARLRKELIDARAHLADYVKAYDEANERSAVFEKAHNEYAKAFHEARDALEARSRSLDEVNRAYAEARMLVEGLHSEKLTLLKEKEDLKKLLLDAQRTLTMRIVNRVRRLLG